MTPINGSLCGVWPVMLTPFRDDGAIDGSGLDALVEWYMSAGVAGLFAVCLSSEMYELTPEERALLAKHVVQRAAGRVPVVAAYAFAFGSAGYMTRLNQVDIESRRELAPGVTRTLYSDGTQVTVNLGETACDGIEPGGVR